MKMNWMKKVTALGATAILGFSFCACGGGETATVDGYAYMAVDINPTVEFVLLDGKVTSVNAVNDDAAVLISGVDFTNMTAEEVTQKVVKLAEEMGYLTQDNAGVKISVATDDEEAETVVECRVLVDELMDTLSGMKGPNAPNPANTRELIERAYAEIDAILKDIEKLNQKGGFTEEEHFEYREENFKDKEETPPAWDDKDVKDWQKENKDKYYNDWFQLKKEWDKDRWYD